MPLQFCVEIHSHSRQIVVLTDLEPYFPEYKFRFFSSLSALFIPHFTLLLLAPVSHRILGQMSFSVTDDFLCTADSNPVRISDVNFVRRNCAPLVNWVDVALLQLLIRCDLMWWAVLLLRRYPCYCILSFSILILPLSLSLSVSLHYFPFPRPLTVLCYTAVRIMYDITST